MTLLLASLALGCGGGQAPTPGVSASPVLDQGWIGLVVQQPELFSRVVDGGGRQAWVAMHQARWAEAAAALPAGPARGRAELERALVYEDLADLAAVAWPRLDETWRARDPAVADGPLPLLAAAALAARGVAPDPAFVQGLPEPQQAWLMAVADPTAAPADTVATASGVGALDGAGCLLGSLELLAGRALELPPACQGEDPLQLDTTGTFHDPLRLAALAAASRRRAALDLGAAGWADAAALPPEQALDLLLFGPWWSAADLAADLAATSAPDLALARGGADGPTMQSLGLPSAGEADDPQAARERVRALDAALDAWEAARSEAAPPDGQALLADLDLVAQARGRILIAWARQALDQDRPHQATAFLMLAHDVEHAGELGPRNPPSLFVLAATASLRTGRTREALDSLTALEAAWPEVHGLDETIGDLAVLEGIGRQGDSKEN